MDRGSGADRIETRELAYFVAVAETCHFGRATQRLGIAQPPLSRAISRLERRLGVVLLERTSRRVALTVAGEVLLAEGRRALDTIDTAVARARTAARPRLRLALKPGGDGGLLAPILAAYRDEPCAVEVELVPCAAGEQTGLLRRGAADAALVQGHQPDLDQLDSEVLLVEPQVVALAGDHPLAGAATLRLADVAANLLPATRVALDPAAALQLVALGRATVLVPASLQGQLRRDVVCVPVQDAAPSRLLLAWPAQQRSPALAAFVRIALSSGHRSIPAPGAIAHA